MGFNLSWFLVAYPTLINEGMNLPQLEHLSEGTTLKAKPRSSQASPTYL